MKPRRLSTPVSGSVRAAAVTAATSPAWIRTRRPERSAATPASPASASAAARAIHTPIGITLMKCSMTAPAGLLTGVRARPRPDFRDRCAEVAELAVRVPWPVAVAPPARLAVPGASGPATTGVSSVSELDGLRLGERSPGWLDEPRLVTGSVPAALCGAVDGAEERDRPLDERRWAFCRALPEEPWRGGAGAGVDGAGDRKSTRLN